MKTFLELEDATGLRVYLDAEIICGFSQVRDNSLHTDLYIYGNPRPFRINMRPNDVFKKLSDLRLLNLE